MNFKYLNDANEKVKNGTKNMFIIQFEEIRKCLNRKLDEENE